jgi:hypothetical protein
MAFSSLSATVSVVSVSFDPSHANTLRATLLATPASGRSAVLLAALPKIRLDCSDASSKLVFDLASGLVEGVSREAIYEYVRAAPATVVNRAFRRVEVKWNFNLSILSSRATTHDVLTDLALVRDRRRDGNEYMYTTGLVHLSFMIASGNYRDFNEPIHRKLGDETLLLLGSSPDPVLLLRELSIVSYHPGPSPSYDMTIAEFCLKNPHHSPTTRNYAVSLLSAPVLAELCVRGVLGVVDVNNWLTPKKAAPFDPQILLGLTMRDVPGSKLLRRRIFALVPKAPTYLFALSPHDRAEVLAERYVDLSPLALEYLEHLSPRWTQSFEALLATARRLAASSTRKAM